MLPVSNPHDVNLKPSPLPGWLQWVFIGLFCAAVVVSGVLSLMEHWRRATFVLGAAMVWLTAVRLTCDSRRVGVFAVRSRRFDSIFTACMGAALLWLSASVDSLGS